MRVSRVPGGARRLGRAVRELPATWRGSLQLRVVSVTMLLSIVIALALGWVLNSQIRNGLVKAKESASLATVSAGMTQARALISQKALPGSGSPGAAADGDDNAWIGRFDDIARSLCSGASAKTYEVLILTDATTPGPSFGSQNCSKAAGLQPESVTPDLSRDVRKNAERDDQTTVSWTTTKLTIGSSVTPGLLYGQQIPLNSSSAPSSTSPSVQIYYGFPFVNESEALVGDGQLIAGVGVLLVVALGGVAWFVTRQVVSPVRQAAGIAERLAEGRFDERMRVRGEDDLARLATSFNTMAGALQNQIRKLEELSRVQRRFVSDVSHELRTPLTTVRMAADVLHDAREDFAAPTARSAELLQTQLDRFEELLGDLLEISRFDAGAAVLDAEPVDLRALAHRVVESSSVLAERRQAEVRIVEPDKPCVAEIDPRRIERILRNLVVNAIEHSEGRPVVVKVDASDDAVAVAVRDYGVGLKPGESTLVFGRFWRADPARARTTGGTGLGLAISAEDAQLHHGWLQAWGEPGGGSQFRLTLPRVAGAELLRSPIPLEPEDSRHHRRQAENASKQAGEIVVAQRNHGPDLTGLGGARRTIAGARDE